jgi:hypothetical protein
MSAAPAQREIVRGDRFTFAARFDKPSHDFTGAAVVCVFKASTQLAGPIVATLTPAMTFPAAGQAVATFDVPGTVTEGWPVGTLVGEVKIEQPDADFGPYRPGRIVVTVVEQIAPG